MGTYDVGAFDPATSTLHLSDAALGQVQPGDSFQGVVGTSSLFVRGNARLVLSDELVVADGSP
ncbi:MAG: hypothetical protein IPP07_30295, partial [Holophagales bacterium]|nr:hypothetical protein [Holophagales bacterium]